MEGSANHDIDLNLKATELRLGLPGRDEEGEQESMMMVSSSSAAARNNNNKRTSASCDSLVDDSGSKKGIISSSKSIDHETAPAPKAQIVGWPPVRSYRKSNLQPKKPDAESGGIYVKVSMDGAPYLRKIDLKVYSGYAELLKALESMFKVTIGEYSEREGYKGSEYAPAYEDKDGDLMLVGDVPWHMFMSSCKKLRIMKGSEARGLGCGV